MVCQLCSRAVKAVLVEQRAAPPALQLGIALPSAQLCCHIRFVMEQRLCSGMVLSGEQGPDGLSTAVHQ